MNSQKLYFPVALFFLAAMPVQADVMYQCVDESGHKSFSNIKSSAKGAKCTAMDLGTPAAVPAPAPRAAVKPSTPATFPKVDDTTQKARDTDRRRILDSELAAEQRNLEEARKELAEQEATVLPNERMQNKGGGGISGGKIDERVQPYRDKVALHERNIEAIQKEISKLR
ncbi:DUF4124 domain-containing protein [Propionivibrio sp.]|uniref:DUF4124 domain-containing protein n=1 Tax=Propionivibrio sp. TaxID=2212460 RepID=UPI00260CCE90|nr:DUF4124 domain-containing protein [Propionivibrio sp.]